MQVFGLPRHVIRAGCVASRIVAKPPSSEAAIRERDARALDEAALLWSDRRPGGGWHRSEPLDLVPLGQGARTITAWSAKSRRAGSACR